MPPKTRMKLAEKNSNKKTKAKKVSPPELMKPEYDGLRLQLTELAEGAQARGAEQDALNAETIAGLAKNGIGVDTQKLEETTQQCRVMQNAQVEHISEMIILLDKMEAESPADAETQLEWLLQQIKNASENECSIREQQVHFLQLQCAEIGIGWFSGGLGGNPGAGSM